MTDLEYQALTKQIEQGQALPVVDQFLFEQEQRHRAAKPNILQQQSAERGENVLLKPKKWSIT